MAETKRGPKSPPADEPRDEDAPLSEAAALTEAVVRVAGALGERLPALVREVADLREADLKKVLAGQFGLTVKLTFKKTAKAGPAGPSREELAQVEAKLAEVATRAEGAGLLEAAFKTRPTLEVFARSVDVAVQGGDTVAGIRSNVVEALVGARLRAAAIDDGYAPGAASKTAGPGDDAGEAP